MENNEEKTVVTVENEGGKGNPNHKPAGSPDGGQFTSGPEAGNGVSEPEKAPESDDLGVFVLKKEEQISPLKAAMMEFAGRKKQLLTQQAVEYVESVQEYVPDDKKEFIKSLSRQDKLDYFFNDKVGGYDQVRLKFASDEQLTALLYAEAIQNGSKMLEQQRLLLEKGKEEINNKIKEELFAYDAMEVTGIWKYKMPHPSDYKELKEGDSYDLKVKYFQDVLAGDYPLAEKMKATQNLKKLEELAKEGELYEQKKVEINAKYIDNLETIEAGLSALKDKQLIFADENGNKTELVKAANAFAEKFKDINSVYSQARKDKAVWFGSDSPSKNTSDAVAFFGPKFEKMWLSMTPAERSRIKDYTGGGYSKYNKPLRGISHGGWSGFEFAQAVTEVTGAIDKCVWDDDIWVQRGVDAWTNMFELAGIKRSIASMSDAERQNMVGTVFTDNGFYSAGAGKGTGFSGNSLILNTYCPRGTKMAYMNTKGHYAGGNENEMILQRGYTYRITKVEKKGSKYFVDCEVILGSDNQKITDMDVLAKLGKKHLG